MVIGLVVSLVIVIPVVPPSKPILVTVPDPDPEYRLAILCKVKVLVALSPETSVPITKSPPEGLALVGYVLVIETLSSNLLKTLILFLLISFNLIYLYKDNHFLRDAEDP